VSLHFSCRSADSFVVAIVFPAPAAAAVTKDEGDTRRNDTTGSGPATNFRNAATEGVSTWGPVMGGVVAIGGSVALIGTILKQNPPSASS